MTMESGNGQQERLKRKWKSGLLLLAVVVGLWVASGFLVNALTVDYKKPYFITYINTGTFALYLTPFIPGLLKGDSRRSLLEYRSLTGEFNLKETAVLSSQFCILWFLSNLLSNASYFYTSVVSATIISCTSSFFTLIIGSFFKVERFSYIKTTAVLISFLGIVLISNADYHDKNLQENAENPLVGNVFALGSAVVYGIYATLLKVKIGDESRINPRIFFGFVGLFNLLGLWPILLILNYTGVEKIGLPTSYQSWSLLITNSVATLTSDYCWVLALLMTSPLVVTVGLSATIPLSMVVDLILNHRASTFSYYIGAILVCWSFFVINRQAEQDALGDAQQTDSSV